MSQPLEIVLLLALPASGKSEVRKYLESLTGAEALRDFHMGPTVQLDDYPYVHLMRRISEELHRQDHDGIFFDSELLPLKDGRDWGTLIELVNEDYDDLLRQPALRPASAADSTFRIPGSRTVVFPASTRRKRDRIKVYKDKASATGAKTSSFELSRMFCARCQEASVTDSRPASTLVFSTLAVASSSL